MSLPPRPEELDEAAAPSATPGWEIIADALSRGRDGFGVEVRAAKGATLIAKLTGLAAESALQAPLAPRPASPRAPAFARPLSCALVSRDAASTPPLHTAPP